jgi:MFS family permease
VTAKREATPARGAPSDSTWAPLRVPIFRALFLAQLGSNIGNWMETVAAQWLLVDHPNASTLVALVQTADMLPFMFLALPAGVLADIFDRRRYLIYVHLFLTAIAGLLAAATFAGIMRPALLLTLTFLEGAGTALATPAWATIIPELVPRANLPAAVALGGINQNLARAIGPAIAGVLVSHLGPGVVFAMNAVTFLFGIVVMLLWRKPEPSVSDLAPEPALAALRAGTRYVRHSPTFRRLLLRLILFVAPAASLWALLPVVASQLLGLGPSGYGLLLGSLGVGAIAGALLLPRARDACSQSSLLLATSILYAAALAIAALAPHAVVVMLALVGAGAAWLTILVELNSTLQLFLPNWVRARGLAMSQLTFMGGQAIAAAVWGVVAQHAGIPVALVSAAIVLLAGAATIVWWPMPDVAGLDRSPVIAPLPALLLDPEPLDGPVIVTVRYTVSNDNVADFVRAMEAVGRVRRRTGAVTWDLFRDGADPQKFVELFALASWDEHLRQHGGRLTGADRAVVDRARAFADVAPEIEHLLPAKTPSLPVEKAPRGSS